MPAYMERLCLWVSAHTFFSRYVVHCSCGHIQILTHKGTIDGVLPYTHFLSTHCSCEHKDINTSVFCASVLCVGRHGQVQSLTVDHPQLRHNVTPQAAEYTAAQQRARQSCTPVTRHTCHTSHLSRVTPVTRHTRTPVTRHTCHASHLSRVTTSPTAAAQRLVCVIGHRGRRGDCAQRVRGPRCDMDAVCILCVLWCLCPVWCACVLCVLWCACAVTSVDVACLKGCVR